MKTNESVIDQWGTQLNEGCAQSDTQAPNNTPPAVVASAVSMDADIWNGRIVATAALLKRMP